MYQLNLEIKSIPKSLNKKLRTHYYQQHKENLYWYKLIAMMTAGKRPNEPLKKAKIKIERHYWRTLDYDNCVSSMKPLVDGLINAGIIESDSWNVLGKWDVDQVFRKKINGPLLLIQVVEQ